jgi:DNA repair exonuclease SbcCD ATPase subunit
MPKEEKTIDIDTSGPGVDIELPEDKEKELENEAIKDSAKPADTPEKSSEQLDVRDDSDSKDSEPKKEEVEEKKEEEKKEEEKKEEEKPEEKKQELEAYSEGVKKRIAKLTKKWREAERQREAALDYAKGVQAEHSQLRTRFSRLEPDYVKALESRVISGIDAAKAKLHTAREANDINAEVEAQKSIAQLGIEEARLNALKEQQSRAKEREVKTPSLDQAIAPQPVDPKAEAWAENNEWFGKDNAMTYSAFDLHKKLTEEEGFDPKSDEYYAEVDKRMRLDFPHKFVNTKSQESTKPTQTVASATRSVKPGRKTVRLTSSQVAIAKKLGVPLEEYAKQLRITKEA